VQPLPEQIAERYGQSPRDKQKRRAAMIITAGAFSALFVTWAIWANLTASTDPIFKTSSFEVISNSQIDVTFIVTKPADSTAICAVQALKEDYGIVAYKEAVIPPSASEEGGLINSSIRVSLRTTELAVTGLVDRCWFE
jgi:hypothetical protein